MIIRFGGDAFILLPLWADLEQAGALMRTVNKKV